MSDGLVIALVGVVVVQFGLLWYRLGRVEGTISRLCRELNNRRPASKEE